ncbi:MULTISPECIES: energy transducer TonB [Paraburkholderia]|uniref:energy transducer TonB n=1 Tax=Paraburkholderia TaxID=1822464 RepID=UPI001654F858|nr:energy transducer TonB [Paraburkholderia podalyriae]
MGTLGTSIACLIALGIWLSVLIALSSGLLKSNPPATTPAPLDMRVVVLDEPASPASRAPESRAAVPPEQAPPHARTPSRTSAHRAVPPAPTRPQALTTPAAAAPPAPVASPAQRPSQDERAEQPAATGLPQTSEEHAAAPSGAATSNTAARSISQPLPTLPDDLREQAYQTIATARFTIHADGSVNVELVHATPNPRLNQLLLDTLRRWRFFPALRDGQPVDSTRDIRVHFNVS